MYARKKHVNFEFTTEDIHYTIQELAFVSRVGSFVIYSYIANGMLFFTETYLTRHIEILVSTKISSIFFLDYFLKYYLDNSTNIGTIKCRL